jgi:Dolichyl-phosphate-mannose-protein mannosyltransferase
MTAPQGVSRRLDLLRAALPGLALFAISILLAAYSYKDYGMSWDEPAQHALGMVTYNYVTQGDPALHTYVDRALGTGFELPLYAMERWLHLEDPSEIYPARHLATHVCFLVAVLCGYMLAWRLFHDHFLACLAFLLIAFHPRLHAHSFFNTKDIPFLSAVLVALLICHIAFETNKRLWYFLLGAACGYATSIRLFGIVPASIVFGFLVLDVYQRHTLKPIRQPVFNASLYILGFSIMLYIAWPLLWRNPVFYLAESLRNLANTQWTGQVVFDGTSYRGDELPWTYAPVWYLISIPELWLLAGALGCARIGVALARQPLKCLAHTPERHYILYTLSFLCPLVIVSVTHGPNIDDWRHLYFIFPSFVMLALLGIRKLFQGRTRRIAQALCVAQVVATGCFIIQYHPYEYVYFNHLVPHTKEYLRRHYDLEYWGVSYKRGLEYILAHDDAGVVVVRTTFDAPVRNNVMLLPAAVRPRIEVVGEDTPADYFMTNFRMHPGDFNYPEIYYEIEVLDSTILRVYKLH